MRKIYKSLNSINYMKKTLLFIIVFIFVFSLVSAQVETLKEVEKGDCITLRQKYANSTYSNITTITFPNETEQIVNLEMSGSDGIYQYVFCNTTQLGDYEYCTKTDVDGTPTHVCIDFKVTPNGKASSIQGSLIQILFIIFFIIMAFIFYILKNRVNLEKWHNSIYTKYENKNYIKLVLSSIGYNVMKNSFVIYYLLGLPIIISLMSIAYDYDLINIINIFKVLVIIYSIGILIVGMIFISHVQEWLMDLLNKIRDMDWGIE